MRYKVISIKFLYNYIQLKKLEKFHNIFFLIKYLINIKIIRTFGSVV